VAFYLQVQLATDTDKTSKRRKLEPETGQSSMTKLKLMMAALAAILFCGTQAKADTVVLTFEGAGNQNTIGNFYNGGAGGNLGIQFGADSLSLISSLDGGSGNFSNAPSGVTIAFFLSGAGDIMNVAAGFDTGFSFFYTAAFNPGVVTVWSGLDGTGSLLANLDLPVNGSCSDGPNFCHWSPVGVTFAGLAKSVNFSGTANQIGFDDVTLGSATAGGGPTATPEPATILLLGAGSVGLLGLRRKKIA
jgi:hypothetical protein